MELNPTIVCICGRIYKFYAYMIGDQSVCPDCRGYHDIECITTTGLDITQFVRNNYDISFFLR